MTDSAGPPDASQRLTNRTRCGVKVFWSLLVGYVLSPYAVWGCLAHIGFVSWTIDPLSKVFYSPLRFLSDHLSFMDDFYRWQCGLFWP